jgi:hypothetical protein
MAISAKPTRLSFMLTATSSGGSTSWATVADVLDITGPNPARDDQIDVTGISSTAAYRTYLPGPFIDPGEVSFNIFYNPTVVTHSTAAGGLAGLFVAGTTKTWRINLGGASTTGGAQYVRFPGYVSAFEPTFTVGESVQAAIGLRVTGAVNWP